MGIAIADEAAAVGGLIDGGLEDPEVLLGATQGQHGLNLDAGTVAPRCQPEQFGVSDIFLWFSHLVARGISMRTFHLLAIDHRGSVQCVTWVIVNANQWLSMIYIRPPFVKRKMLAGNHDMP